MKEICNTAKLCTLADYLNYGLYILDHRLEIFLDLLKVFTLLRDFWISSLLQLLPVRVFSCGMKFLKKYRVNLEA